MTDTQSIKENQDTEYPTWDWTMIPLSEFAKEVLKIAEEEIKEAQKNIPNTFGHPANPTLRLRVFDMVFEVLLALVRKYDRHEDDYHNVVNVLYARDRERLCAAHKDWQQQSSPELTAHYARVTNENVKEMSKLDTDIERSVQKKFKDRVLAIGG